MNKRIRKKKAKQAELQRQQELTHISPNQLEDVIKNINQAFQEISKVITCFFDGLAVFFEKLEVSFEETKRQRTQMAGRGTFRFSNHPAYNRFAKARINNQKSRQSARSFNRHQQTNRKHGHQTRR